MSTTPPTEPSQRRLLVMAAPPKPVNEMTDAEVDAWAHEISDAMADAYLTAKHAARGAVSVVHGPMYG